MYDVIIVGGGPAGLSAALILGRCCRKVLVIDAGQPRNAPSRALHGFITRDGTPPGELLRLSRKELVKYGVVYLDGVATHLESLPTPGTADLAPGFRVTAGDQIFESRKILLATGVKDEWPQLAGAPAFYGRGVFHCPYCDGWEYRGKKLIAFSTGEKGLELALSLRQWSENVTLCTQGIAASTEARQRAQLNGIALEEERIEALLPSTDDPARLAAMRMSSGRLVACDALFFSTGQSPRSPMAEQLGCQYDEKNQVCTDDWLCTSLSGCYCAGDAGGCEGADLQLIICAAAEGATAAVGLNKELLQEEIALREREWT